MKTSVLINNYNYGKFLKETIDSVLHQTYNDVEIIVYDDGSMDESLSVLDTYGDKIKTIKNKNFGKVPSLNQAHAIEEAYKISSGDIIFFLDSDDLFHENKIKRVVDEFKKNKKLVCVQHTFKLIDKNSNLLKKRKRPVFSGVNLPKAIYFTGRLDFFFTQTSGLAFTKNCLNKLLPFKEDKYLKLWPDLRLTRNAVFIGDVIMLNEDLGFYRLHQNNDSSKLLDVDYLRDFEKQHLDYFNLLSKKYKREKFYSKSKYMSILNILFLLAVCDMKYSEKYKFLRALFFKR